MKLLLGILFLSLAASSPRLSACSWVPLEPSERVETADLIFNGRVLSVNDSAECSIVEFVLYSAWKWDERAGETPTDRLTVHDHGGSCKVLFQEGADYLVYARYDSEMEAFVTSLPQGTQGALSAVEDYAFMGETILTFYPEWCTMPDCYVTQQWKWLNPIGLFWMPEHPWIFNNDVGWIYAEENASPFWSWSHELGWIWIDLSGYRYVYSYNHGWVYCSGLVGDQRWYYLWATQDWISS